MTKKLKAQRKIYLEEKRSHFQLIIIWFSYNDVRCVTKMYQNSCHSCKEIKFIFYLCGSSITTQGIKHTWYTIDWGFSKTFKRYCYKNNNYSSVYFWHICVGISRIFQGNVTDSNTTELFELNVRYWSRYVRWKWKCFILVK